MSDTNSKDTLESLPDQTHELFTNIASSDFLNFEFMGKSYNQQIEDSRQSTGKLCAVTVEIKTIHVLICSLNYKAVLTFDFRESKLSGWLTISPSWEDPWDAQRVKSCAVDLNLLTKTKSQW